MKHDNTLIKNMVHMTREAEMLVNRNAWRVAALAKQLATQALDGELDHATLGELRTAAMTVAALSDHMMHESGNLESWLDKDDD